VPASRDSKQCRDASAVVDQNIVWEHIMMTNDVGHLNGACPFDHCFEPATVGECVRFKPRQVRPQLAYVNTEASRT
jgi:hypothetical protein